MIFPRFDKPVIIIEPSQSIRSMVSASVRESGYKEIIGVSSIADALRLMETDSIGWLIMPLQFTPDTNTLGTLKLCQSIPVLQGVHISVVASELARDKLEYAFELGALSFFPEHSTQDQFSRDLSELLLIAQEAQKDPFRITSHYLRKMLIQRKSWDELIRLEKKLCSRWAGDPAQLLNLAKAYFEQKNLVAGELALAQAETINPNLEKTVKNLSSLYLGGKRQLGRGPGERFNVLGISNVLVVDGDEATQNALSETFRDLGVPNVSICSDGEAGIAELKKLKSELGLIVQEWRLAKIPGYAFIQRVRDSGSHQLPIIVLSSLLQRDDQELIVEFGANDLCAKPFSKSQFVKVLINAIQQERTPTDPIIIEKKIRKLVAAGNIEEACTLFTQSKQKKVLPRALECLCAATIMYAMNNYASACRQATEAIRLGAPAVLAQSVLGKSMMKLGHYAAAIRCFEKAQTLSPKNVERMCALAEAYRLNGDEDKAENALGRASALDQSCDTSQAAQLASGIASEDPGKILNVAKNLKSVDDIISLTNNRAVALVKIGKVDDAVLLYNSILEMLPSPARVKLVPVNYNIGLAFVRNGDLEKASLYIDMAVNESNSEQEKIKRKALSLKTRIQVSKENGTLVTISATEPIPQSTLEAVFESQPYENNETELSAPYPVDIDVDTSSETVVDKTVETLIAPVRSPPAQIETFYVAEIWPEELKVLSQAAPKFTLRTAIEKV